MQPQYRFIPFHSFVCFPLHFIPLQALSFIALHSSSIMSAALRFCSGGSFAQPSGLAPLPAPAPSLFDCIHSIIISVQ